MPCKSGVSVSHSPVVVLQSSPTGLHSQMLWELLLLMPGTQAGEPDMGLRILTLVGKLLQYNYSPVCGWTTQGVWDLIISRVCPSYHHVGFLLYVFGCRISFLVGSSLFLIGCSAISCNFGVLVRGGKLKVLLLHHLVSSHKPNILILLFYLSHLFFVSLVLLP